MHTKRMTPCLIVGFLVGIAVIFSVIALNIGSVVVIIVGLTIGALIGMKIIYYDNQLVKAYQTSPLIYMDANNYEILDTCPVRVGLEVTCPVKLGSVVDCTTVVGGYYNPLLAHVDTDNDDDEDIKIFQICVLRKSEKKINIKSQVEINNMYLDTST